MTAVEARAEIFVAMLLIISVLFGCSGLQEGDKKNSAISGGISAHPSLFEVRQQCNEIAAFFPVDPVLARRWVPPAFELLMDARGKASGAVIFMNCPKHYMLITPDIPSLQKGKNIAPASIVHLWFMLKGHEEILPVPGAKVTGATKYAYVVADLVTSPVAEHVYQRAGKNCILITSTTLSDEGKKQMAEIIFTNGSKIILNAFTPAQLPEPLKLGGHIWNYHVSGDELNPAVGTLHNINKTRVMILGLVPGQPNTTQVTIHAEPGTLFADYYGTSDVVSSQATFFRPNNIVNNSSSGELLWATNPPYPVPAPPSLP